MCRDSGEDFEEEEKFWEQVKENDESVSWKEKKIFEDHKKGNEEFIYAWKWTEPNASPVQLLVKAPTAAAVTATRLACRRVAAASFCAPQPL